MDSQTAVPNQTAPDASTAGKLKPNSLGVLGILFFVLSAQAPLTGVAGAVPIAVAIGNGAGAPAAYLAAGLITLLFSVGFVAMGRHVVDAGAFYRYIGKGLGQNLGNGIRHRGFPLGKIPADHALERLRIDCRAPREWRGNRAIPRGRARREAY